MSRLLTGKSVFVAVVALGVFLAGCSGDTPDVEPAKPASARPAAIMTINPEGMGSMSFSGVVRAAERADLAFRVPGKLTTMTVEEGDKVQAGEVLAELEQEEFLRAVDSAKVEFDKAQADYQRGLQIFESTQAIAKADLEKLKAQRDLARNRLSNARQDLDNSRLQAPFTGVIAQKVVSNFQNVNAGQTVYVLNDLEQLEVVVNIPSKFFLKPISQRRGYALIEGESEVRLPLSYKSYSPVADSISQTYRVVLELIDTKGQNVLPGMNARVHAIGDGTEGEAVIQVPVQAVVPTNTGDEFVWVVGDEGKVEKRLVEVGRLMDDQVVVEDGLATGDRIVTAGVGALTEGMKVRPLDSEEQP
ncbi:efflux RND transporter periplasmic adaptor subunit [Marinobacter sp. VGCF2001]|uniref:efflux RND transporter periplasmic adaptor subunit n=1 Tax=Marinobacter sp. VGCF2001 TaxID=3417189 RepID=UPI003CECDF9A